MAQPDPLDYRDSEVVIGVVAPVGADLRQLNSVLKDHLEKFHYTFDEIRLSSFLKQKEIRRKHKIAIDEADEVNAVVTSASGEVIATGANDVPTFGGGLYWPGRNDQRDFAKGIDSNKVEIDQIATEIVEELLPAAAKSRQNASKRRIVKKTSLSDLTEFGRPVHAEMEALLHCARSGVSPIGGTLFTTTFPCHNCAKHIIASGVHRVFFVEPYPKSKASHLHSDAISIEREEGGKVSFLPFVGVAARRYFDLFSMRLSSGWPLERKIDSKAVTFNRGTARPRVPMPPTSYIEKAWQDEVVLMAKRPARSSTSNKSQETESYWQFVERTAKEVDKWPAWKIGGTSTRPQNQRSKESSKDK